LERRLAAILIADVVDYSRLMGEDEARMLAALTELRQELFEPVVARYGGKVIKRMGDGWIVEYPNVSDAVASAIEVQESLSTHEIIRMRVGIHSGDVTFQDDDVYGDGINVAARLEAMAQPGQMLISDTAYHSLDGKAAEKLVGGETRQLKNIVRPVGVWYWPANAEQKNTYHPGALSLPDKPSLAVLPFDNMSGDVEQEYFSDGITEDIITALSRLRWLFVIARNSTFTYKGQAVDITEVGRELGVRYVLEGSVRKSGQRVRVTAQLIEAATGNHIWAERYDRHLADIFDLQDELTEAISAQVNAELAESERQQARKKSPNNLDTWELYQRAQWHHNKYTREGIAEARRLYKLATERAPEFASAYAGLALVIMSEELIDHSLDRLAKLKQSLSHSEKAVALDGRDSIAQYALGRICILLGNQDRAIAALEKSIELNPSSAMSYYGLGHALVWFARAEEAIPLCTRAIRFSPHDPQLWAFYQVRSIAHSLIGEFELAIADAKASIHAKSNEFTPHLMLAVAFILTGRREEARVACERACELKPNLDVQFLSSRMGSLYPPYLEKFLNALGQAGLPG
jgi:adenylate cyclase